MKVIKRVQVNALGIINMQYAIQFEHPKRLSNNGSCWTGISSRNMERAGMSRIMIK